MEDDMNTVGTINNSRNVELTKPECLPEQGPYLIQMRDLTLQKEQLEEVFEALSIQCSDMTFKVYHDNRRNIDVYTYFVEIPERSDAAAVLSLNGQEFEDCILNARYWVRRNGGRKERQDDVPTISFKDVKSQRGTGIDEIERNAREEQVTLSFAGARGADLVEDNSKHHKSRYGDHSYQPVSFNRNDFGTEMRESSVPKRRENKNSSVTLDWKGLRK